MPKIPGLT